MDGKRSTVGVRFGVGRRVMVVVSVAALGLFVVPVARAATPGHFHKLGPANAATGVSTAPTLKWGVSQQATGYRYCVDRTNNRRCDTRWVSTHEQRSVQLRGLAHRATYYWQVKAVNAHGSVAADGGKWFTFTVAGGTSTAPVPRAGNWRVSLPATSGSGGSGSIQITSVGFSVAANNKAVASFGFGYTYSGIMTPPYGQCSGSGSSWEYTATPINKGAFATPSRTGWSGPGSATFNGTFTSATRAHGTASFQVFISGSGCQFSGTVNTRTVSWSATAG